MRFKALLTILTVFALAALASAPTKISGTLQCGKPDQQHAIDVGDRPNHSFVISQTKCTWTKPLEIAGVQGKEDVYTEFSEVSGNRARVQGYGIGTMTNGDKFYGRLQCSFVLKEGATESGECTSTFVGGSGKLKGVEGTSKGKGAADGTSTWEIEGEYELPK
jgi:hypothetical protein